MYNVAMLHCTSTTITLSVELAQAVPLLLPLIQVDLVQTEGSRAEEHVLLELAGLMNFLAQLSDKIHHFTVYNDNLMPLAFLTKLSKIH